MKIEKFIKNHLDLVVFIFFVIFGILFTSLVCNGKTTSTQYEDDYMDSCWIAYNKIDAAYRINDGDAFDMDFVDSAAVAYEVGNFEEFIKNWREVDKDIVNFLLYRVEEGEIAAINLMSRLYPTELNNYYKKK